MSTDVAGVDTPCRVSTTVQGVDRRGSINADDCFLIGGPMGKSAAGVFDPFDTHQLTDPYPGYRWLRDEAPVHYLEEDDLWVVSRYDHCLELLRDPTTFSSKRGVGRLMSGGLGRRHSNTIEPLQSLSELRVLIAVDPPDHVRLRRLVNRPFTPREVGAHESWMRHKCEESFGALLDANAEGGADWVRDFTWPFPVNVIGRLLGIPASLSTDFKRWSDDLVGMVGGLSTELEHRLASFMEMFTFFHEAIARRRAEPTDDLIGMLIHNAEADDDPLTADELVLFCVLLLAAGNETTTNLLSNAMRILTSMPDLFAGLRSRPESIPAFIEEVLRYDGPVQALPRGTTKPTTIAGVTVPADSTVLVYFASANRDDRHFPEPDRFDVDRNPVDHVGFGSGIHLCLGAPLARLEARVALETLCHHATGVELTDDPVPTDGPLLRGAKSMPLRMQVV